MQDKRRDKFYVTGANGFLGRYFLKHGFVALKADVTDYQKLNQEVGECKPDVIVHLAGLSNPNECETYPTKAHTANILGTAFLSEVCADYKTSFAILSSSQIWGGGWLESLTNKHSETSKLTPARNVYGMTKVAAESLVRGSGKVIRASKIFDRACFATELEDLLNGKPVDAPRFLKRSFIHADEFVSLVLEYCKRFENMPPILHLAGSENVSYYDFWLEICHQYALDEKLVKGRKREIDQEGQAPRPHNSGLDVSLAHSLGFPVYDYKTGIKKMLHETKESRFAEELSIASRSLLGE